MKKLMARKPDDRFQTPQDVAAVLQMFAPIGDQALPFEQGERHVRIANVHG